MSYGFQVYNSSGRAVIDTVQGLSLLYATDSGTATANNDFPTTSWSGSDLIIARPADSSLGGSNSTYRPRLSRNVNGKWGKGLTGFPNANNGRGGGYVVWRELKAQSTANLTPSGRGLVVYDGAGTASSNVLFSATDLDATAALVATGKFNGTDTGAINGYYTEFTMDSSLDEGRYYAIVSNAQSVYITGSQGNNSRFHVSYDFDYAAGKIRMLNYLGVGSSRYGFTTNVDWAIFYVINGGTVDNNFS